MFNRSHSSYIIILTVADILPEEIFSSLNFRVQSCLRVGGGGGGGGATAPLLLHHCFLLENSCDKKSHVSNDHKRTHYAPPPTPQDTTLLALDFQIMQT